MSEKILAWHFLPKDCRMTNGDGRLVEEWKTYTHDGELILCESGLHASVSIIDALQNAPGPVLCRVEMGGEIINGDNMMVATERTVLWMLDTETLLWQFACRCAERAIEKIWTPIYPDDKRPQQAIEARRAWARGEIGDEELKDASAAAAAAAAAAYASARASYAADAAADSVYAASYAAAYASDAARSAACAAADAAEREWQETELLKMIEEQRSLK